EVSRDTNKLKYYFHNALSLRIISSILSMVLSLIILFFYDSTTEVFLSVFLASLAMLFYNLSEICMALFNAYQKMEYPALMSIVERIITVCLSIIALLLGFGIIVLVIIYFLSYFVIFLITLILTIRKLSKVKLSFDTNAMRSILKESFPFWQATIFYTIYFKINTVMLSLFKGYQEVGWFNASYSLLESLIFIPVSVARAIFPLMSKLYTTNKDSLVLLFQKAFYYLYVIGIAIAIGVTILSDKIIYLIYGTEFSKSITSLQILIWAVLLIFLSTITMNFLNAINKQRTFSRIAIVATVINLIANLLLIPRFGYIGSALATLLTELLILVLTIYFIKKYGYQINLIGIFIRPLLSGLIMASVVSYVKYLNIFIVISLGVIVYFFALLLFRAISKEDMIYFKSIIKK
ncbi:MAG: flippase, partial [Nanoarchaeota archaeon]